jgi:hypothetical protein
MTKSISSASRAGSAGAKSSAKFGAAANKASTEHALQESRRNLESTSQQEQEEMQTPPEALPEPGKPAAPAPDNSPLKFKALRTNVLRSHRRYLVKWKIAIVYEGGSGKRTYYGRVNDISLGGLSIHCDHNIFYEDKVILLLMMPPLTPNAKPKILEITCRMIYTILSRQEFRIGLEFLDFRKGEKKMLSERLEISNAGGMAYSGQ